MILSLCFKTFLLYYLGQSLQTSLNTRFLVPEKCILLSIDGFNWSEHIHDIFSTVPRPQQVLSKYCYFHPMTTHLGHLKKNGMGKSRVCFAFPFQLFLAELFLEALILLQAINHILFISTDVMYHSCFYKNKFTHIKTALHFFFHILLTRCPSVSTCYYISINKYRPKGIGL